MSDTSGSVTIEPVLLDNQTIELHCTDRGEGSSVLFLHGWGLNSTSFIPLMDNLSARYRCLSIDLPGFGRTAIPPSPWSTVEYAECVHQFIVQKKLAPAVLIGHSFGGRIAVRMASRWPEAVRGMALVASAGLRKTVPIERRLRIGAIRSAARLAKRCIPGKMGETIKQSLYRRIASRDYLNAGDLKEIFIRVVNEELSDLLPGIQTPVLLLWGSEDTETPPELGWRMHELLPNSTYIELPGFDHHSILDRGRHQAGHQISQFLDRLPKGGIA